MRSRSYVDCALNIIIALVLALWPMMPAMPAQAQTQVYYLSDWVQGTVNVTPYGWNTTGAVSGTVEIYDNAQLVGVVIEVLESSGGYAPTARVGLVDSELWNDRSGGPQDYYPSPVVELCTDFDAGGVACPEVGYTYNLVAGTTRIVDLTPGNYQGAVGIDSWELEATYTIRWALILWGIDATPMATPVPLPAACISASLVSEYATPTPTSRIPTPTPFGTLTPGPTPTITPTPAGTPTGPISIVEKTVFGESLAPWTSNGAAVWSSADGPDTLSGVAVLPFTSGSTLTQTGTSMASAPVDALVFEREQLPTPWRIAGDIHLTQSIPAGMWPYVQVFEWRDAGLGTGQWYLVHNQPVNVGWHTFTATSATTATVRAVALRAVIGLSSIVNPLGFVPQTYPAVSVEIDNLRLGAGRTTAHSPTIMGLPVCADGSGFSAARQVCVINSRSVNVFAVCKVPTDLLNIGGWIDWLMCHIRQYFWWDDANTTQLWSILDRNKRHQPIGIGADVADAIPVVQSAIQGLQAIPAVEQPPDPDWSSMIDATPLDHPMVIPEPDWTPESGNIFAAELSRCPAALLTISSTLAPAACWAAYQVKSIGISSILQWMLDIGCWLALIMWFYRSIKNQEE